MRRTSKKMGTSPFNRKPFQFFSHLNRNFRRVTQVREQSGNCSRPPPLPTPIPKPVKRHRLTRKISQVQKIPILRLLKSRDAASRDPGTKPAEQVHQQSGVRVGGCWLAAKRQSGNPVCPLPLVEGCGVGVEAVADCVKASSL